MRKEIYDKKNDILILQRNVALIISIVLFIIVLLLSISLVKKDTNIILVPFGLNDKVSISTNRPQNSYLEAISRDVINTMLNLTPENISYAEKVILSYVDSKSYGVLKNQFKELKENIISKKVTTSFYPIEISSNNQNLTVIVDGILYNYLGQKEVSNTRKKYEIKYKYKSAKLTIVSFNEIIEENKENNK